MNEYDSELIQSILENDGYTFVSEEKIADVILLNTCSVRDNAVRRVFENVHQIRHDLNGKPTKIGILGCIPTNLKDDLIKNKNLNIDFIAGPDSYKRLPELIEQLFIDQRQKTKDKRHVLSDITLSEFETYSYVYPSRVKGVNAWIAIMRGCNNFCTFCVVPYTRGRERSRSSQNIIDEAKRLADEGFKQATLLGQNVNSYKSDGTSFSELLNKISKIEGIKRIRFMSPHPKDFPDELIDMISNNEKVCKHIHLPLQSGNSRVLKIMNRKYSKEDFLSLVDKIKHEIPKIVLTTDIIVGFPTETEEEFKDTVDVMKKVEFDSAFIFKYSPRKETLASKKYEDNVSDEEKTKRIVLLNKLQKKISLKKNTQHVGETLEILLEETSTSKSSNDFQGRTDGNKLVIFPSCDFRTGDFVKVKIEDATPHVLKGSADR